VFRPLIANLRCQRFPLQFSRFGDVASLKEHERAQ
jgi:hypothetical protein